MTTAFENYSSDKCGSYDAQGRRPVQVPELLAQLPDNCSVLDGGCGTGNYMVPLIKSGKVAQYTGIDYSHAMVQCTKDKIPSLASIPIKVFQHSLHDTLPFEDNTFDAVLHNQVMHHIVYPDQADPLLQVKGYLAEFNRVLKPGGVLAINMCTPANQTCFWWVSGEALKRLDKHFPELNTVKNMLTGAGFNEITHSLHHETLLGDMHYQYEQCFTEEYRRADSGWAILSDEELKETLERMKNILGNEETRKEFDEEQRRKVREVGVTTQIFARK